MRIDRCGWTIVEVLVVTVIIGILVSFAIPSYIHSIERSQCSQAMANLRTIRQAQLSFFTANQQYSNSLVALGDIAGADLVGLNASTQWNYSFASVNAGDFNVHADRLRGPHAGDTISLNELDQWNADGSAYPIDNP
jgi:type IV pilus assembly protein PilE